VAQPLRQQPFAQGRSYHGAAWARPRTQVTIAWALALVAVVNGLVIVWLWLQDGGISGVHGASDLLTTAGRITGLIAAYLLLIQVLLIVRIPWLERAVGFDRLTVWHRRNGKAAVILVIAHVVFITLGYAGTDRISVQAEVSTLLTSYPGMVTATIGTGFLLLTVGTSLVIVRRQIRYEAWYLVHLSAYAGILLGWFHQIPTGNEFAVNSTAAAYWTALYLVTLALLVAFRFLQPAIRGYWHRLRVSEVVQEGPGVVSVRMTGRHLDRLPARAGQFFLWRFLTPDRWFEAHPFSLSQAPDGESLRITVKSVGDFTSRIGEMKPGTRVLAEGPFGVFTDRPGRRDPVLLIAGGIGITPIRALAEEMEGDVVVIYRAVRDVDVVLARELESLAASTGLRMLYVVGDHRAPGGDRLLSPEHVRELVPDITTRQVYICGPPGLVSYIEGNVRRSGVPRKQLHIERFAL
jgi:predicted ferric reductase